MKSRFIAAMDLLQDEASRGDLTLRQIFRILGDEGHAMLILFFCLPFLQPIPIPGLSTPLGFLIILVAVFLYLHKSPWLPKRYEGLRVSSQVVLKVSEVAERIWRVLSRVIKGRWTFFHDFPLFRMLNLLVFIFNAVLLSLPLPIPFSNTFPTIGIILCAFGHLEKDGLFILFSYLWCLVVGVFFTSLAMGVIHLGTT